MNATNKTLSIIAYYLSEYDMMAVKALGFKTRNEAIQTISSNVGNGNNYLKLRRDEFDALPDSSSYRKGWRNRSPIKDVLDTAAYLHQFSFDELTAIVQSLINSHVNTEDINTKLSSDILVESMDEGELERIINYTDSTARIIVKTQRGNHRIYNQALINQLKRLYRGNCQLCGFNPVSDFHVNICEAHHICYFSKSQNNNASNLIIVCPNHHKLIHKLNPVYNVDTHCFQFESGEIMNISFDLHLTR